ncbi:hypothetical protein FPF71_04680 [Algibacter amylolyticus]|uniref:Uncharacterized protein n=1 Tax=Algibacter amylolyticus TaxID=1608400 RepID=A0A5M7BNK0_9FLAO|nr:hypothetical protein [Algibacter amylolyticus]KAA5828135.1 hypothetical protein F2B50_04680 [Algibacter amylolyticus]MBB5267384.1 hypothetical protein [Algibacter amylolyticus]TSJ82380.1 hypothetical protein FPF71_04680 [Algibacter amylolyticus]
MKIKFLTFAITCLFATTVFAQANINNYKYVIVSKKYDFLKEKDQYQLNSLTKFLFEKYGFEAVMEGSDYPEELNQNRCLALFSDVTKEPGMFKTRLAVTFKDCNDKLVYTSEMGESREKEFKTAYNLALRDAFKSIEALNYKYVPNENLIVKAAQPQVKTETTEQIQHLKKEIELLKQEKEAKVAAVSASKAPAKPKVVAQTPVEDVAVIQGASNVLYAQAIDNGFQLVDSSPKVVYRIKNTNLKDVYLVEGSSSIVYKKGNDWVIEYYAGASLEQETLNIKF